MGESRVANNKSSTRSAQNGNEAPSYTKEDSNLLDRLMDFAVTRTAGSDGKQPVLKIDVQQRPTYSERDLEKFNKMFSEGNAPYARLEDAKEHPVESVNYARPEEVQQYSQKDDEEFSKLHLTPQPRVKTTENVKPKPVRKKKAEPLYSEGDLELFNKLGNRSGSARTNRPAKAETSENTSIRSNPEKRAPHIEQTDDWKPRRVSDLGEKILSEPLNVRRPGMGDIKLRYFK